MSGYKRAMVTISQEEYRRLHESDMRRRFREHTTFEEIASNISNSFAHQSQRFRDQMQRRWEEYYQSLNCVVRQLDVYGQREQAREESARQWLRQSVVFSDFIHQQFDHERFLPGRLSKIYGRLELAQQNLAQGFFESSLQTSQQAFLELSELNAELEKRVVDWEMEYERAYRLIKQILERLEQNSKVTALGLDGEELDEKVDLAYWTNDRYRQLVEKAQEFLVFLEKDRPYISTEGLKRISMELPPAMTAFFESLVYEARLSALNSQLRMNIAERALQALEVHGFQLSEAGYTNKDMRSAFTALLANPDGSRVTVQVIPTTEPNPELANELVVVTNHPHLKSEHEARLQWEELSHSLQQFDLKVSRPEIRSTPPIPPPGKADRPRIFDEKPVLLKKQSNVR
jgi:hypothetical protein